MKYATITLDQVERSRDMIAALKAEENRLGEIYSDAVSRAFDAKREAKKDGTRLHDVKIDEALMAEMDESGAAYAEAKKALRLEEVVYSGLVTAYLAEVGAELLERMEPHAEKLDGQKIGFKRPAKLIEELSSDLGARVFISTYSGCIVIELKTVGFPGTSNHCIHNVFRSAWEGCEHVYRFDADSIRTEREIAAARAEELLPEDEIRAAASEMLADIEALEAEKKALAEKVKSTKKAYHRVFGYDVRELESL